MRRCTGATALLFVFSSLTAAEPAHTKDDCLQRFAETSAAVGKARLGDEMQARVDEELARVKAFCEAGRFDEAERAAGLAQRLAAGEPDPE